MPNIIDRNAANRPRTALFELGFRPFFLLASLFAVIGAALWVGIYIDGGRAPLPVAPMRWHAHEMIYGYSVAIIAGFLLTAVKNWTGLQTARGLALAGLATLWTLARIAGMVPVPGQAAVMAVLDLAFTGFLIAAIAVPVIRARARRQAGILGKLALLGVGNVLFYAGALGWLENGTRMGVYFGLYLVIALILTMGRRVIPFFTERGVGYPVTLQNWRWLDIASLALFVLFMICEVFFAARSVAAAAALALFLLYGIRLWGWHTPGLWRKSLLWSLYAGYGFIVAGFPLYTAAVYFDISPFLSVHAFAFGGIGVVTLSMIARVSLGHTGRNIHRPPRPVGYILTLVTAGALIRVGLPLIDPGHYLWWVAVSGIMWIMAFAGFALVYIPILIKPRIDGQPG